MRHRRSLTLAVLTAALAAIAPLGPAPAQEDGPAPADEDELPPGLLGFQAQRQRELSEALAGSWQLVGFRHVSNDLSGVPIFGMATFTKDNYLHLLIHTQEPDPVWFAEELLVQGGVHHWRIDSRGILQTATLMAHTNFDGGLLLEPAYTPREYQVQVLADGNALQLRRVDGSELSFVRLGASVFPEVAVERLKAAQSGRNPFANPVDSPR